jgi:O-antigen/teichoic acid export membrane protein
VTDIAHSPVSEIGVPHAHALLRNSVANLIMGAAAAIYSLAVPAALVRALTPDQFAVWALVLQLSGYAGILGLGLQDAIGRYVAFYAAQGNAKSMNAFASTSFSVLCAAAVVAMCGFLLISASIGVLFPQLPRGLRATSSAILLAVGVVVSLGLPFSVFSGALVGLRRNDVVSLVMSSAKLLLAAVLIVTAWVTRSLIWLTFWFVALSLASYVAMWSAWRASGSMVVTPRLFSAAALREISRYCGTALVWQGSMFVITGLDVVIVGRFDFPSLAFYSVSITLVAILWAGMGALFGPLIQVGAAHAARGEQEELATLLVRSTRLATIILLCAVALISCFGEEILQAWLGGEEYAARSARILLVLVVGHSLRQITFPYAAILIAMGQQGKLLLTPVIEAAVNLTVALLAGRSFGAIGVAYAVVAGALVMLLLNFTFTLPRTHGKAFDRRSLLVRSIFRPLVCFLPMSLLALANWIPMTAGQIAFLKAGLLVGCGVLAWYVSIEGSEKTVALALIGRTWGQARRLF